MLATMRFSPFVLGMAVAITLLAASPAALAAPDETLCSDRPALLKARAGVYVTASLPERVRLTRRWDLGQQNLPDGAVELRVGADGGVDIAWNWHEGATFGDPLKHGCLVFDGEHVRLQHSDVKLPDPLVRIATLPTARDADAPYFDLLFAGCFTASGTGERWCFDTNRITIAGTARKATLKLDLSELPTGGSVLAVAGEPLFWLFVPRPDGWAVYRTTWASADDYREPDWPRPWKLLTRRR